MFVNYAYSKERTINAVSAAKAPSASDSIFFRSSGHIKKRVPARENGYSVIIEHRKLELDVRAVAFTSFILLFYQIKTYTEMVILNRLLLV